jgi:hypothetical protein
LGGISLSDLRSKSVVDNRALHKLVSFYEFPFTDVLGYETVPQKPNGSHEEFFEILNFGRKPEY